MTTSYSLRFDKSMNIMKVMKSRRELYWGGKLKESKKVQCSVVQLFVSFISSEEVLEVSGIHGVTLSPKILKEMSSTTISAETTLSYPTSNGVPGTAKTHEPQFLDNEKGFRDALSSNKEAARKLQEAIAFFLDIENQLEDIMRNALQDLPLFAKK